jgi:hypothetical protein
MMTSESNKILAILQPLPPRVGAKFARSFFFRELLFRFRATVFEGLCGLGSAITYLYYEGI